MKEKTTIRFIESIILQLILVLLKLLNILKFNWLIIFLPSIIIFILLIIVVIAFILLYFNDLRK